MVISSIYVRHNSLVRPIERGTETSDEAIDGEANVQWSIVLVKPDLMFPPHPLASETPEPSSSESTLLFRIPLWMDVSMHLLPALALALRESPVPPIAFPI